MGLFYLFYFLLEVVCVITVLHQKYNFLLALCIVVELNHIFMFKLWLDHAFLARILMLNLVYQFFFHNAFFDYALTLMYKKLMEYYLIGLSMSS